MKLSRILVSTVLCMNILFMAIPPAGHAAGLRLGMTPEPYMPYTQINAAGEWEGFEADLTNIICGKITGGCERVSMAWEGLIPSLTENKVDFIVGAFSITDKRREVVDFSLPYYTESSVLVGMKSDTTAISNILAKDGKGQVVDSKGLQGKILGVQNASVQAAYVKAFLDKIDSKSYPAADNVIADLTAGRIDYALLPKEYVQPFLESKDGADYEIKHEVPGNVILGEGIAYAVRKGDSETLAKIDAVISQLTLDGTIEAMIQKWFFGK